LPCDLIVDDKKNNPLKFVKEYNRIECIFSPYNSTVQGKKLIILAAGLAEVPEW
jgi:hypothetical protein